MLHTDKKKGHSQQAYLHVVDLVFHITLFINSCWLKSFLIWLVSVLYCLYFSWHHCLKNHSMNQHFRWYEVQFDLFSMGIRTFWDFFKGLLESQGWGEAYTFSGDGRAEGIKLMP